MVFYLKDPKILCFHIITSSLSIKNLDAIILDEGHLVLTKYELYTVDGLK